MIEGENKMIDAKKDAIKTKEQEYHYPGETKYHPITIKATNQKEADDKWLKERVEVESEKVENKKQ